MKVKVGNSSSRRTREKIKKAFATLMEEKKSLNKITITELVQVAEITRGAFYTHYDNIYEVAKELQDETFAFLLNDIEALQSIENMNLYFDQIFNYLKQNEDIYTMILSSNDPLLFIKNLDKLLNKRLYETLSNKNIPHLEMNISLFIDGCMSLVMKHFRHEIDYSLDEINRFMQETFVTLFLQEKRI